jgi:hypothetical protein
VSETANTNQADLTATYDPADDAMCSRARERFTADRNRRLPRRRSRHATLPNFIIIGGLKCGTTSIHHYLGLHPEVNMSKPKELNFFAAEQNWDLGLDWYKGRFDDRVKVNGESSPHYTNRCQAALHGAGSDQADPLPLGSRNRCRIRNPRFRSDPRASRHLLHPPLDVLDAAPALP